MTLVRVLPSLHSKLDNDKLMENLVVGAVRCLWGLLLVFFAVCLLLVVAGLLPEEKVADLRAAWNDGWETSRRRREARRRRQ